jgi:hypothetical protein
VESDHDMLVRLREQVRQLEEKDRTRSTREWFLIGGIILSVGNIAIDRLGEPAAAVAIRIVG